MAAPVVEPLGSDHDRASFFCGVAPLDRYLKQQASQDIRNKVAAVYVLRMPGSTAILGYYTLCASIIERVALDPAEQKRLPRYSALPAILIGRLAVSQDAQGKGWGTVLLVDALRRSFRAQTQIAAVAVTVDAKDDAARAFYERYGFQRFQDHPYRLYLPMKTVEQLPGIRE